MPRGAHSLRLVRLHPISVNVFIQVKSKRDERYSELVFYIHQQQQLIDPVLSVHFPRIFEVSYIKIHLIICDYEAKYKKPLTIRFGVPVVQLSFNKITTPHHEGKIRLPSDI